VKHPDLLQDRGSAPGGGLQIQPPTPLRLRLDRTGDVRKRVRNLFINALEINASALNFDAAELGALTAGRGPIPVWATGAFVPAGTGSHSDMFQSPCEFRTRFKLGRVSERVPRPMRPRRRLDQRSRTLIDSARRKYSCPKRGSSATVTDCASSTGPPHKLNL